MLRGRTFLVRALSMGLVVASCSSGGRVAIHRATVTTRAPVTAAQWSVLPIPPGLSRYRRDSAFVSVGTAVLIVGGEEIDRNAVRRIEHRDGWLGPMADGTWKAIADVPTQEGLANAAAVWDGHEAIVVGVQCPDISFTPTADSGAPDCPEAAPTVLAYNPEHDRWRTIADGVRDVSTAGVARVGWSGRHAFFEVVDNGSTPELLSVDPTNDAVNVEPPGPQGDGCISSLGQVILTVAYRYMGHVTIRDPRRVEKFHGDPEAVEVISQAVSRFDLDSERWLAPIPVPDTLRPSFLSPYVFCTASTLILMNSVPRVSAVQLDLAGGAWRAVPDIPGKALPNRDWSMTIGDQLLFWLGYPISAPAVSLTPSGTEWTTTSIAPPPPAKEPPERTLALDDGSTIALTTEPRTGGAIVLRLS